MHDYYRSLPGGVTLVAGGTGSFEVYLNDRRLFSKLERERFPEETEIETQIGKLLAPSP